MNAAPDSAPLRGLRAAFRGVPALHGIDLDVVPGESNCGKSVTWLAVLGLLPAAAVSGHVSLSRARGIAVPYELHACGGDCRGGG